MAQNNRAIDLKQCIRLLHYLYQVNKGSTESTALVIAYMSLLSFLAAGIFGLLAVLIVPRPVVPSPEAVVEAAEFTVSE